MNRVLNELNVIPYWNKGIKGKGTVVAVLGSGFAVEHPEFEGRIAGTKWMHDDSSIVEETDGHETSVASVIAGNTVGIAPEAKLLLIKCSYVNKLDPSGASPLPLLVANGIDYAIEWVGDRGERVSIINIAFGGTYSQHIHDAIKRAVAKDIIVIVSAGNIGDGNPETDEKSYPAVHPEVVSVGAYWHNFQVAHYSNSNSEIDLISAGINVDSAIGTDGYRSFSGTSSASPCVVGVTCLLRQKFTIDNGRYPSRQELTDLIIENTTLDGITGSTDPRLVGSGRLRLNDYVELPKIPAEQIDLNVAIDGICWEGIFDSPQFWKDVFEYVDGLPPNHPEYQRFRFFGLAYKKFYQHIL